MEDGSFIDHAPGARRALTVRPARARRASAPVTLLGLRWRLWLMTFGHLVIDSNGALLFALLPLFVTQLHINLAQAGALSTILLMTSSITQPLFGFLHDRYPLFPMAAARPLLAGPWVGVTRLAASDTPMVAPPLLAGGCLAP